jgi:hypothetical protein
MSLGMLAQFKARYGLNIPRLSLSWRGYSKCARAGPYTRSKSPVRWQGTAENGKGWQVELLEKMHVYIKVDHSEDTLLALTHSLIISLNVSTHWNGLSRKE